MSNIMIVTAIAYGTAIQHVRWLDLDWCSKRM